MCQAGLQRLVCLQLTRDRLRNSIVVLALFSQAAAFAGCVTATNSMRASAVGPSREKGYGYSRADIALERIWYNQVDLITFEGALLSIYAEVAAPFQSKRG